MPISRRRFLAGAAGAVATIAVGGGVGAVVGFRRGVEPPPFVAPIPPDALTRAVAREQALLGAHASAQAAHPEVAAQLAPIIADHTAHLDALARELALITQATTIPTASAAPGSTGAAPIPAPPAPQTTADALAALQTQEGSAALQARADCLAGIPAAGALDASAAAQLATLLGCISAAESVHAQMLT
jgi:FtsP/CotA-like multicopper oxidase with cupredoxin domain